MLGRVLLTCLMALSCACARRAMPRNFDAGSDADGNPNPKEDAGAADAATDAASVDAFVALPDAAEPEDAGGQADAAEPEPDAGPTFTITASESVGGTQGGAFDDRDLLPMNPDVASVTIRSGDRLDYIEFKFRTGSLLAHGGNGGSAHNLELASGEVLTYARLCVGEHDGSTRVFYARFGSSLGREVAGGNETDRCTNFMAPEGQQISGMFGRSGGEVDALGFYYTPRPTP